MRNAKLVRTFAIICFSLAINATKAQTELYPQHFPLEEVTLLDSPYKIAMDRNIDQLLQYDVDRLLTPFVRQAGLSETNDTSSPYYQWETLHPNFENWAWNPSFALDGHVGGHYLSALALAYAACHDETVRQTLLERLNYMIEVLKDCQDAFADNTEGLKGYIGGLPDNSIWTVLYSGSNSQYSTRSAWVPFYVVHKTLAGLRDAYIYAGNATALTLLKGMGDWAIEVVAKISASNMDSQILGTEHGGVNEVLADLYALTGEEKYLEAAKKYSHQEMVNGMQTLNTSFLDYKHANTQVPKYVGFERISQVDANATNYHTAALNFWTDVTQNRTVAIGGNSVDEHFLAHNDGTGYLNNSNGPETCNTNNMLKLSEDLFDVSHEAQIADFYEKATLNHILSTQDPETGGYVYFTPLRPQCYRIYSVVNEAMWCCVGTGMENHSKYGHFVYTHNESNDTLWINLFTASELDNDVFALTQKTGFPYDEASVITVRKGGTYTIAVRHPAWTTADYKVTVSGEDVTGDVVTGAASYVYINKVWSEGDVIEVSFPMELTLDACPNYSQYVALRYGPTVLAARTPTDEGLDAQYAGTGRMDHAPGSMETVMNLATAPMLIGERETIIEKRITPNEGEALSYTVDASHEGSSWTTMTLEPFFSLQNERYIVYWNQQTEEEYANSDMAKEEEEEMKLEERTLDKVATGEQQSEAGHNCMTGGTSSTGVYNGEYYRDASANGYFEYDLSLEGATEDDVISVMFRYAVADAGRVGYIYIDGELLQTVTVSSSAGNGASFYNAEYLVPESMLRDADGKLKEKITVRMAAGSSGYAPGVYYIRLLRDYQGRTAYTFLCTDWTTGDVARVAANNFTYDEELNTITVTQTGQNNIALNLTDEGFTKYYVKGEQTLLVVSGADLSLASNDSFLWWLNGTNKWSSVAPTYALDTEEGTGQIIVWDITQSGINDTMKDTVNELNGDTIFGLTSTMGTGICTLSDVSFYTPDEAADKYPELAFLGTGLQGVHYSPNAEGKVYDLRGIQVSQPMHGIYVTEGHKIMMK